MKNIEVLSIAFLWVMS